MCKLRCYKFQNLADAAKVRSELPKQYAKAKSMHKSQPLAIQADAKMSDLVCYKACCSCFDECVTTVNQFVSIYLGFPNPLGGRCLVHRAMRSSSEHNCYLRGARIGLMAPHQCPGSWARHCRRRCVLAIPSPIPGHFLFEVRKLQGHSHQSFRSEKGQK